MRPIVGAWATEVGNLERPVPAHFIRDDGLHVTPAALDYSRPLLEGELPFDFVGGFPIGAVSICRSFCTGLRVDTLRSAEMFQPTVVVWQIRFQRLRSFPLNTSGKPHEGDNQHDE